MKRKTTLLSVSQGSLASLSPRWSVLVSLAIVLSLIQPTLNLDFGTNLLAGPYHPVSVSSAIVELGEKNVRIEMQIMLEDLVMYHSLRGDEQSNYTPQDLLQAAQKHRQFLTDYFSLLDVDGKRIPGKIESEVFDQIGADPVPQTELMKRSISFLINYDLPQERPPFLTFLQTFGGEKSALPAVMDLYITRNEVFEESAQISINRPHTIKIDWQRNVQGKRQSLAELRKLRREQLRERLGIGSYSGLYSFLYINRFEVRHEILIPLTTLEQFVPMERANRDFLEVDEQQRVKPLIEQFFSEHGRVSINGQNVAPSVHRVNFFSLDIADFALNADPRRIGVYQGRVGVIVSYPSKQVPAEVDVQWDKFSDYAPFIDTTLLIGNQPPDRAYFYPESTKYQWKGQLVGPLVQPVKVDGSLADPAYRQQAIAQVLENIYRAFDYRRDEDVYDSLATSVQGALLRELYLRIKRSLVMAEQGNELSQLISLEIVDCKPSSNPSNGFETTWQVTGVSEHWGHIHTRTSEYRADIKLINSEGIWRLDSFRLLDEKRIRFETSIRGHDSSK